MNWIQECKNEVQKRKYGWVTNIKQNPPSNKNIKLISNLRIGSLSNSNGNNNSNINSLITKTNWNSNSEINDTFNYKTKTMCSKPIQTTLLQMETFWK